MHKLINRIRLALPALVLGLLLSTPNLAAANTAAGTIHEEPSMLAMSTDLLVVRPITAAITVVGAVLWVPFGMYHAATGGNFKESAKVMVGKPFQTTFIRCLGCSQPGYRRD